MERVMGYTIKQKRLGGRIITNENIVMLPSISMFLQQIGIYMSLKNKKQQLTAIKVF